MTGSFHPLISSALTFIFSQFLTFCKCKPLYFRLLLLMMQYFRFKHGGKVLSERRVLPQRCLALNHLENKSVKWRNELMLNTLKVVKKEAVSKGLLSNMEFQGLQDRVLGNIEYRKKPGQ